ncbi:sialate O-acetylesterase [Sphingobacterium olei]|uniref:Sialate O-acetylesterase n=1 Tax=Sphingobacterium olei TaxID=2571155 RepID=A0A4U0P486_9SPHI|nr:sialate O-acetylesterase [Sphingobacterium olei]TJZ62145.1 sialate O-acetylesterase [Sphingobacterium olei]
MRRVVIFLYLAIFCVSAKADIVLPNVFAHHMVLQRDQPVSVFGSADVGEDVVVEFDGQRKSTRANADGYWKIELKAMKANSVGQTLRIRGKNEIRLNDVLVGEVWLCSGQSNMEYPMRKIAKEKAPLKGEFPQHAVAEANNAQIRIFLVRRKFLAKPDGRYEGWSVAQDSALRQFSAPAYFFGKKLQEELGVPVGIISSAVSGSRIEPWLSESALQASPYFKDKKVDGDPGKFYHSMIEPLAPYTIKGFVWYQGETNVFLKETVEYAYKLNALITEWRDAWHNPKMPFYFTQLAPFHYSLDEKGEVRMARTVLPEFREAQDLILQIPYTARIITTDLADNVHDIHPNYKWEIGRRHALKALKYAYKKDIPADGPEFRKVTYQGKKALVHFSGAGDGLQAVDGKPLTGFEVAGIDDKYYPADAVIRNATIVLESANVPQIQQVRFAWDEAAQPNLVNGTGLPAAPFRTNNPNKNLKLK